MKHRRTAALAIVGIVLSAGVGWVAGTRIQSPAEAAAQSAPPTPSPILVPVEMRRLSTNVVTRGTGRFDDPIEVWLPPTELKAGPRIVTGLPEIGIEPDEGDVLLTVAARPVFIIAGSVPTFRDLGPGMTGPDVLQLEEALRRLGWDPGQIDGVFDEATGRAVSDWYQAVGHDPIAITDDQAAELQSGSPVAAATPAAGVLVPADEILTVPSFPVRVSELFVAVGEPVEGVILSVTGTTVLVAAAVPVESAGLLATGMDAEIDEPALGIAASGVISFVAPGPGTHETDGFHVHTEILVAAPPPNLLNASVRLTIAIEATEEPVLAVPLTALSLTADGSSQIQRQVPGGFEFVDVTPGLSADGFVAITPTSGVVNEGDLVVVGFETPGS